MSMHKRDGFLYPNQISELVWDSKSEGGASNDCIFYLGNTILCFFKRTAEISLF